MFILFGYAMYYPSGGLSDCRGVFRTIEEAQGAATPADYHEIAEVTREGVFVRLESCGDTLNKERIQWRSPHVTSSFIIGEG